MESMNTEVVRESAIFAALSPRGYSRRERPLGTSDLRGSSPENAGAAPSVSLPPVTRDANSILRASPQHVSPQNMKRSAKTPQSLMMSVPMTTNECWLVWKFLCDWVKTQLAMEVPASIPGFGTFYIRVQSLGIRITLFEPDKQFLNNFGIQKDSEIPDPAIAAALSPTMPNSDALASTGGHGRTGSVIGLGNVFAFSFVEMAACCGNAVDAKRAQEWLTVIIHKLGNAMSQCGRVELNIGIGIIVCADRVIHRHLLSHDSRTFPRLEYEIRTGESVVKRNLRAQAALQTAHTPKTKLSFLSGSTFSSSIQLNPVVDRSKDVPDFSFGPPNPRPPTFTSVVATSDSRSSPRSTQLQKRYQRSQSPLINRISTPVVAPQTPSEEDQPVHSTTTMQKQTEEIWVPPQLFDRLCRTLCVEPDLSVSFLLPSNRIGSNFTDTSAFLMTEKSASQYGQVTQHSGGLVFIDKPILISSQLRRKKKELTDTSMSEKRYFEYLSDDKLIDHCFLAPLPSDLETRVLTAAVNYFVGQSSSRIKKVMETAHREFVDNYYSSAKRAILNYLLLRATSCERLGIPHGVPIHAVLPKKWKWGSSNGPNGCLSDLKTLVLGRGGRLRTKRARNTRTIQQTSKLESFSYSEVVHSKADRRKRVQSKLMSLLVLSNPQVRALRYMWHDLYTSVNLVDLPNINGLSDAIKPMDIIEFERAQLAFSAKIKAFVMENWYGKTKMMFESAIGAETYSIHTSEAAVSFRLRHFFDTVAAVMSLQIRSLIMKSIQAYVKFFELFGKVNEGDQESDSSQRAQERPVFSGLLTTLLLDDGQIMFRDPLVAIPSRLLNVLHNIPKMFYNLGRIETQFEEPLVLSNTSSPFLWNVASQEDDIVVATIRIRSIIEHNLTFLRKLQSEYDVFALTHRYVNSVDCFQLEENGELETYRAEMERVQTTAMRLAIDNRHSQNLGLFSVDCRLVNTKLHTELAQWTIRLLQAFEQRIGRMNAELRQQYKEIAARLAKKPLDLYELVDAEVFVQSLKADKQQELQERGNAIKQRLRYLLFERENMHIGNTAIDYPPDAPVSDEDLKTESLSAHVVGFRLSIDLLSSTAKTVKWRGHIEKLLKEADLSLVNERARIEAMFIAKRSRFHAEIEEFEGEVRGFAKKGDLRHAATYAVQLAKMKDNMFIFRQAMDMIIKEEQKLQWKPTDFGTLDDIAEEMAPYEQLWKTVREFREMNSRWLRGNVFELPGKEGMQTLQQMLTVVANVSSALRLNSASAAAAITAETVRKQMTDFRENVRLIVAIQNPAMKERHMKEVSGLIGLEFSSEVAITLLKLLENGAFEMVNDIVDICCNATQEQLIERALNEMGEEWEATSFELVLSRHPYSPSAVLPSYMGSGEPNPESFNVVLEKTCAERIAALMNDHLLRHQTLSCMSHADPFIEDIALWQAFASEMGQVVEMLTLVEQLWRKLTPLFAAGIVENDSTASQLFGNAAQLYQSIHATVLQKPACTSFFQRLRDLDEVPISPAKALISDLEQCRVLLETVRGDVRVGFEAKRSSFARFYFLSDAELVTALALANIPDDVTLWKALSRCFPGIYSVLTNAANEITGLLSSEGEPFPLGSPIVTADTPMPTWLAKLETSMTTILHASIRAACSDLPRKEFRKWCLIWPEQSLLAAIQHTWTLESEQAYQNLNQRKAWTELTDNLHFNIESVSKEIKVAVYPHAKVALENVLLLLTQLRDVSNDILEEVGGNWVEENVGGSREMRRKHQQVTLPCHSPSLTWITQPRFYFIDSVLSVTMLTSSYLPYGLEYLGNGRTGILVTPLTMRCYHAIAQVASTMIKGVCLEGAAGTGKSTICHQLARLCGRLCATFQCGNRKLSFDDLVNFVKATASSGAWLCIDNFHLLDPTTVSMVTMLCAQVTTNIAARHAQCTLVGDKIRLKKGTLFLLTLTTRQHLNTAVNYAARDERLLLDAKCFFRTVIVQSPDMEKLAEFELQRGRFVHTSELAKLITVALTTFERGFELMNNPTESTDELKALEPHLVSLRAIKSVVKRAKELNSMDIDYRRRTRKSILISPDLDEEEAPVSTDESLSNDTTSEAIAKRDEERMEHRNVYLALREHFGAVVPSSNLHLIDSIMRDFNSLALAKELHLSKNVLMTSGSSRLSEAPPRRKLEDDVESYVRTNEISWKRFGVEFGLKSVQLLQTMRNHRAVVLSGDMLSGKTSLYGSLARALTHISTKRTDTRINARAPAFSDPESETSLVAPTRCVVICPRALRFGQLLDVGADDQSHSVFGKLLKEAKVFFKNDKCTQTWLIFDGDLDALWSDQLLHTVEEAQDDFAGYRKGLQLSSGKYLNSPRYVRIVMETTTLMSASPSFMTRVGPVHMTVNHSNTDWENVYRVWKTLQKATFEKYAGFVFAILDKLVIETVSATLEFVALNFKCCDSEALGVERFQWVLTLFSSALKQSWIKFGALTSDKQRITAIHCLFLQSLVWGVGSTTDSLDRHKFHLFLFELILHGPNNEQSTLKRLLTLFFPNGTLAGSIPSNATGEKAATSLSNAAPRRQTIYDYGFSLDFGSKWLLWTEYYNRWVQMLLETSGSNGGSGPAVDNLIGSQLNCLLVPTGATSAAICLSSQLLLANIPAILTGPRDCGKSVCGSALVLLNAADSHTSVKVDEVSSGNSSSQLEPGNADLPGTDAPSSEESWFAKGIYAGYYTRASDVLLHFEAALQRIRIEREDSRKHVAGNEGKSEASLGSTTFGQDSHRTVFVFVDDLHCIDPGKRMDSAIELVRMLAEYETVIDPSTNLLTPCQGLVPFGTLQVPTPSMQCHSTSHDLDRLVRRFVPIVLQPFTDADLTTICESFSLSVVSPSEPLAGSTRVPGYSSSTSKEAEQLRSLIIKASLKLYRLLTSNADFTILSKDAAFTSYKLHYNYQAIQLFQIVKSICCEICPPLFLKEKAALTRLWCHESARILGDGIMDSNESFSFHRRVIDIGLATFAVAESEFFPTRFDSAALQNQTLTQSWFANDLHFSFIGDTNAGVTYRNGYHEVSEMAKVELVVERSLKAADTCSIDSNASNGPESMQIILCSYVLKHVLRVVRLLRMGIKAMLLLGPRGRKLVTITRLACLICKKGPMVYQILATPLRYEPVTKSEMEDHTTDREKWNAALRVAMLKSVRSHDAPIVFIVKDVYLQPEAYVYRIIDQFLGGCNMPSEVVAHEDLDEELVSILREKAQQERKPPQIIRTGSHHSVTTHLQAPTVLRSKSAILDYFFRYVRQKLQIILILSPPSVDFGTSTKSWASILWRYPNILKRCDVNYAGEWPADALITVAQKCLAQTTAASDKQSSLEICEAAVQVYEATRHFMVSFCNVDIRHKLHVSEESKADSGQNDFTADPYWNSASFPFVVVEPSMLVDHLGLFSSRFDQLQNSVLASVSKYKAGLEFIDQTAHILETEQAQAALLLPEVREKTELRRKMSGSLEREKIATDKVTRGLELAATVATTQRERLLSVTQEYNDLIKESRLLFEDMRSTLRIYHEAFDRDEDVPGQTKEDEGEDEESAEEVAKIDSSDAVDVEMVSRRRVRRQVRKFVSLHRIPSSIYQLAECLGVILGIEPVEGHDEMDPDEVIMNYWENVAAQMTTAAFWKKLTIFEVPTQVTDKMVSVLLPICTSPDFDRDLFGSMHEIAGVLCEWVQKCTAYARDFILAIPKFGQLKREQELLKQAEAQLIQSKIEIHEQTTSSLHASELRDVSEMERQRADEKLQDTTSLLHLTNAAWKVLSSTRTQWKQRYDTYSQLAEHWKGDLLLSTAVIAYASSFTRHKRLALHKTWTAAISSRSVLASPVRRPLHEVFQIREEELTKMRLNGLPKNDESALENAVITLHSYRLPLLIDPYAIATDWLTKQLGSNKCDIASAGTTASDAAVWKQVETSIKRETALILTDICKERMHSLHSFLDAKRRALFEDINRDISRSGGRYRCWCYGPEDIADNGEPPTVTQAPSNVKEVFRHVEAPVFEFFSDACRVFLIYTDTNAVPNWLAAYQSQVNIIRFELTAPFVEAQALQKLLESQGCLREFTEIRALQQEMLICDEQIYGLEEELLEFFSTKKAEQVYSENSKTLRIVANRSSVKTLQTTKGEAKAKVKTHWGFLESYRAVARRCLDAVWVWREFNFVIRDTDNTARTAFSLAWVWQLLIRAGELCKKSDSNIEIVMACFTNYLQQWVTMNLRDEDRLLFRFLLAFRIWQRRMEDENPPLAGMDVLVTSETGTDNRRSTDMKLLARLLALVSCKCDRNSCQPALKSLLALRPTGMKATTWSAVCYLAEASGALRQFISGMGSLEAGQIAWKALLELGASTCSSADWDVPISLDVFTRLCVVVAVHTHRLLCELEDFASRELQRIYAIPTALTHSFVSPPDMNPPSLSTVVAAAAHSALTQAPNRHRDLFYLWQSFSSAKAPLVVCCPPSIDFVDAVLNVAKRAEATMDTTDTTQLLLADEPTFKKILLLAMERGQWVVLHNIHTCQDRMEQVSGIYESLGDGHAHSDFRLWISVPNQSVGDQAMWQTHFESMRINRIATRREWGTGFLSLKRSLHHTFAILKHELDEFTFSSTISKHSNVISAGRSVSTDHEVKIMKELGVFHALVSCRDHFEFAQWKRETEFGDTELCAAIRSLVVLRTDKETVIKEQSSPLCEPSIGIWNDVTLRGVIANIYASTLDARQDQLLVQSCINFVISSWPELKDEVKLDTPTIIGHTTIAEAVFVIDKLATIPWISIESAITHFWESESGGPPVLKDSLNGCGAPLDSVSMWDPHNSRRKRRKKITSQLAVLVENSGYQLHTRLPACSLGNMEAPPLLDLLTGFGKNLEGVLMSRNGGEYEYRKPISALVNHEKQALQQIRAVILRDIRKLEEVGFRGRPLDPALQHIYEELRKNCTPAKWLALLRINTSESQEWGLERFQTLLLDRLNTFAAWVEPKDCPHKLPLDKFLEIKYAFEAVHQHFVRNHVGNAMCYPDCLKIVSIIEESPKHNLPVKEDVVYFTGVRAMGHLQLQIIDTRGHFRHTSISPDGVPVILQVTSSCVSVRGTSALAKRTTNVVLETTSDGDKTKTPETSNSNGALEFLCPLVTLSGGSGNAKRAETSLRVVTTLPIPQLVLSGASLYLQTIA